MHKLFYKVPSIDSVLTHFKILISFSLSQHQCKIIVPHFDVMRNVEIKFASRDLHFSGTSLRDKVSENRVSIFIEFMMTYKW